MSYTGITPDALLLLSRNRFEDSKEFYEAHKVQIKQQVFMPMAQLIEALADDFRKLDPQMQLLPSKMLSRVRRDTRFTKQKHMYRDEVWAMFMRPKVEYPFVFPCMWFEIKPGEGMFSAGVCVYDQVPAYMQFLRQRIAQQPKEFLKAAQVATKAGAVLQTESYKKDRAPEASDQIKPYLNAKSFMFKHSCDDLSLLESDVLVARLRAVYGACGPMYRYLQKAAEDFIALAS